MNIKEFHQLLPAYIARDLSAAEVERFELFAKENKQARALLKECRAALAPLLSKDAEQPSREVVEQLYAQARTEIKTPAQGQVISIGLRFLAPLAAAASLIVLVALSLSLLNPEPAIGEKLWQGPQGQELSADLHNGELIRSGDNGSYVVRFSDDVNLQLGPHTEVLVRKNAQPQVTLRRGNLVVDGARGAQALSLAAGDQNVVVDFETSPTLVSFGYSTPVRKMQRRSDNTFNIDYERATLKDVIALGKTFGISVRANAEIDTSRWHIDIRDDSMDRESYVSRFESAVKGLGFGLDSAASAKDSYVLINRGSGSSSDTKYYYSEHLDVALLSGTLRVDGQVSSVAPESKTPQRFIWNSDSKHLEHQGTLNTSHKELLRNVLVNADLRFDIPLRNNTHSALTAIQHDISGEHASIVRKVFSVDSAMADTQGQGVWIKLNNSIKLYEVGKQATFGNASGKLIWANGRGALMQANDGNTIHVSFR